MKLSYKIILIVFIEERKSEGLIEFDIGVGRGKERFDETRVGGGVNFPKGFQTGDIIANGLIGLGIDSRALESDGGDVITSRYGQSQS